MRRSNHLQYSAGRGILTSTASSQSFALTPGTSAVTLYSRTNDCYVSITEGSGTVTAGNGHFIAASERQTLDVVGFTNPYVNYIYGPTGAAASIHVTELQ